MIGLQRGTVTLCEYDSAWPEAARATIETLRQILGSAARDIQHVGSTAVPGMAAKPVIDLAVGVRSLCDVDACVQQLEQAGIYDAGQDVPGQRLFVMGDFERDIRTHHIHVMIWNSDAWKNYIRFRDYLNAFEQKRMGYEAEKKRLAQRYGQDRRAYTKEKAEIIKSLLAQAERWEEDTTWQK